MDLIELKGKSNRRAAFIRALISVILTVISLCALTSCDSSSKEDGTVRIYDVNREWTHLVASTLDLGEDTKSSLSDGEIVERCLNRMIVGSKDPDVVGAIGKELGDITFRLEGSVVTIDFTQKYYNAIITERVLRRAAVVKTLCNLEGVTGVAFTVEGNPIMDSNGQTIGVMTEESFVENDGAQINSYERTTLRLYFADADGTMLKKETEDVVYSSNISMEKLVMEHLVAGPDGSNVYPTINPECKVMNVTTIDGICYVNLSSQFLTKTTNVSDEVTVYSIVNSLTSLSGINKVQIMIDGETEVSFGNLYLSSPFEPKYSLSK